MSAETDRKFFDTFMVVLGTLVVISIAIFFLATALANRHQVAHLKEDPAFQQRIEERIRPIGQVAIAGRDNSALRDPGGVAPAAMAPAHAAWQPRIDQGMDTLVRHAIEGFQGQAGYMPPRGGFSNLSDEQVRDAVQYMVDTI